MQRKHKQRTNADLQPKRTYTRQHLNSFTSQTGATHRHLHKTPKEKEVATSLFTSSSLGDRSHESLRRGAPSSSARSSRRAPDCSDGVLGELDRVLPRSRCGRGGEWQALRPGTAPTGLRSPVHNRTTDRTMHQQERLIDDSPGRSEPLELSTPTLL